MKSTLPKVPQVTRPHRGLCAYCCATRTIPADFRVCCWNPTGCACVPVKDQPSREAVTAE